MYMTEKILKWKCPHCEKEITSMYPEQFEYNKKAHLIVHKNNVALKESLSKVRTKKDASNKE